MSMDYRTMIFSKDEITDINKPGEDDYITLISGHFLTLKDTYIYFIQSQHSSPFSDDIEMIQQFSPGTKAIIYCDCGSSVTLNMLDSLYRIKCCQWENDDSYYALLDNYWYRDEDRQRFYNLIHQAIGDVDITDDETTMLSKLFCIDYNEIFDKAKKLF